MLLRARAHGLAARSLRALPAFRGKGRLGMRLDGLLRAPTHRLITRVILNDGSLLDLDPGSPTEQWTVWTGEYDRRAVESLTGCLAPGDNAIDIGANVGLWSMQLAMIVRSNGGRVWAFEPVSANAERLRQNCGLNQRDETLTVVQTAVGDEEGVVHLHTERPTGSQTGNAVVVRGGVAQYRRPTDSAPIARLDRLAGELGIDTCRLIKIDIEGAETMALRGGRRFIARTRPFIYGEFNPFWMKQLGTSFAEAFSVLSPLGYRAFAEHRPGRFRPLDPARGTGGKDVLLVPRGAAPKVLAAMNVETR